MAERDDLLERVKTDTYKIQKNSINYLYENISGQDKSKNI